MLEASLRYPCDVRTLSFKGATTFVCNWAPQIANARNEEEASYLQECLLYYIAHEVVSSKEGRSEPRAVKKRPKNYQRLTAERHVFEETKHRNLTKKQRARKEATSTDACDFGDSVISVITPELSDTYNAA